ncbi:MAG: hypothetical protein KF734_18700 [Saprospiraceae bacterium]|nr:hypothetical protein [Saprospiraceae bacterium]
MLKFWISLSLLFAIPSALTAQSTGLLVSDERYGQLAVLPTYNGAKYTEIPVRVSLKKYCPVPGDQRQTGSCVGWAVGYGAFTIQRAILNNSTEQARITQEANSAAFIYNQVRRGQADCADGAYLEDALTLLKEQGDCLERTFNYEQYSCHDKPGPDEAAEASSYRAQDFAAVFALDEDPKAKVGKACRILATKTPLVVGVGVTKSFFEVLPGAVSWNPAETEPIVGYHALVLVGYNSVEKYFDLLNSFGPSWGQNGFIRLAYDDFERLCRYAFVIVPDAVAVATFADSTPQPSARTLANQQMATRYPLSGEFVFRRPAGFVATEQGDELMYFEEVETRLQDAKTGLYVTAQPSFRVGEVFQLVAREVPRGRYVYVFSQGPDGTLNQHFPRKKDAVASAGFMLDRAVEIVVPDEEHLLQLSLPGDDYLCILYSHTQLPDFEQRLRQIAQTDGDFPRRVRTVFSDLLISAPHIQFSAERMAFAAQSTPAEGRVAAVTILRVKAD